MDPRELTLFVTATANSLYERLPPARLAVLAELFTQMGDTMENLAAKAALLEALNTPGEDGTEGLDLDMEAIDKILADLKG